jgi:hypothetical protein
LSLRSAIVRAKSRPRTLDGNDRRRLSGDVSAIGTTFHLHAMSSVETIHPFNRKMLADLCGPDGSLDAMPAAPTIAV